MLSTTPHLGQERYLGRDQGRGHIKLASQLPNRRASQSSIQSNERRAASRREADLLEAQVLWSLGVQLPMQKKAGTSKETSSIQAMMTRRTQFTSSSGAVRPNSYYLTS